MAAEIEQDRGTRMLFLGDDSLADGFRLIGFEIIANPDPAEVDRIFRSLDKNRERAFVIVDDRIMGSEIAGLKQVRSEGGSIVIVSIPALKDPARLSSEVADRLTAMFGNVGGESQ
jgi:vacuolar-type H+-ATPase subunit F/Vma7